MAMLSASDIAGMQRDIGITMIHHLVIETPVDDGKDADGQPVTGTSSGDPIMGLVEEQQISISGRGSDWPVGPGTDPLVVPAKILLPWDTVVSELSTVHWTDPTPAQDYEVLFVRRGQIPVVLVLEARRIPL